LRRAAEEQGGKRTDLNLIGQFGVGFYSAYLVADRVEVTSRAAGSREAHLWVSDGRDAFTVAPGRRVEQGTDIVLQLKADQHEFLEEHRIRDLVKRYSDYIEYPVDLRVERKGDKAWERVNEANALWRKPAEEVTEDQYAEFYRHLTHDLEAPVARGHFRIEGTQEFVGLLFVPKRPPFDLFLPDGRHGVRLYVKRVFIMDDCEELLPRWLRFVRGVVDSEDLPLNVSRELLQDSRIVRTIRKQVVKHALDMIEALAESKDYPEFWASYGAVLKEGLHFEPEHKARVAKLLRYESSTEAGPVSLASYVARMKPEQKAIYYVLGASRAIVENGPHLEALRKRGYEVLLMTDAVDAWAVEGLEEFDGKQLVSAMDADHKLDEEAGDVDERKEALGGLLSRFREVLQDQVSEVRVSRRLTDSPVCLVLPTGGLPPYLERLMRLQNADLPRQKRILEVHPEHALVESLRALHDKDGRNEDVKAWIEVLYDQALLAEGSPIENPARFTGRLTRLLAEAAAQRVRAAAN
jgi:molecular chaperone HtpG